MPVAAEEDEGRREEGADQLEPAGEREITRAVAPLPFAYFCGFGSYYAVDRKAVSFSLPGPVERSAIVDEAGHLQPDMAKRLLSILEA